MQYVTLILKLVQCSATFIWMQLEDIVIVMVIISDKVTDFMPWYWVTVKVCLHGLTIGPTVDPTVALGFTRVDCLSSCQADSRTSSWNDLGVTRRPDRPCPLQPNNNDVIRCVRSSDLHKLDEKSDRPSNQRLHGLTIYPTVRPTVGPTVELTVWPTVGPTIGSTVIPCKRHISSKVIGL